MSIQSSIITAKASWWVPRIDDVRHDIAQVGEVETSHGLLEVDGAAESRMIQGVWKRVATLTVGDNTSRGRTV